MHFMIQPWFPDLSELLADPHQEGSAVSSERLDAAPEPGVMEPSCVAASGISEELILTRSQRRGRPPRGVCML